MRDTETQRHKRESETNRDHQDRDSETVSQRNRQTVRAGACWGRGAARPLCGEVGGRVARVLEDMYPGRKVRDILVRFR